MKAFFFLGLLPLYSSLVLVADNVNAQRSGGIFYHLTTKNGLSSNRVNKILQDRKGYYWIATEDGLNRFDGTTCKVFRNIKDDSTSLSNNSCQYLIEDDLGNIWVGTQSGVSIYLAQEGRFRQVYLQNQQTSSENANAIKGIAKDASGNIYVSSYGFWQYNIYTGRWKTYLHDPQNVASIPIGYYGHLFYDSFKQGIWLKGYSGYIFFDPASSRFYSRNYNPKKMALLDEEADEANMILDQVHRIWFYNPVSHYLNYYSETDNKINSIQSTGPLYDIRILSIDDEQRIWIHHWISPSLIYSMKKNMIDSSFLKYYHRQSALSEVSSFMYVDHNGNYWICSNAGVSIYSPHSQSLHFFIPGPLPSHITSVAEQNEKKLWVGTHQGLYDYDLSSNQTKKINISHNQDSSVRCLLQPNDSVLWIGESSDLLLLKIESKKVIKKIMLSSNPQFLLADGEGNIWVGTWRGGLYEFSPGGTYKAHLSKGKAQNSLYSNSLLSGNFSPTKNCLWIGYNGGSGFSRLSTTASGIEHFKIDAGNSAKISNTINCIMEDKKENLWIGTYGSGICYFNPHSQTVTNYSENSGLNGNYVNSVFIDDSSRVWVSTNNGLNILDTATHAIVNVDVDLEQYSNDLIQNCVHRKNGKLLFFNHDQIVEIDPASFLFSPYSYPLRLSSFRIFDKEYFIPDVESQKSIRLSYKQNFFSFEYSLLKPNPNGYAQYAYRLEGFDKEWNYARERRYANYTNVPPGDYTFRTKAADATGRWIYFSVPLQIHIEPPFWKKWWFAGLMISLLVLSVYLLFRYRIRQVHKMYRLRSGISKDLHDEIGATLTSISFLSEVAKKQTDSPVHVENTLEKIGSYSRDMIAEMNDIVWAINPLNDSFGKIIERMQNFASPLLTARGMRFYFEFDEKMKELPLSMRQRKNLYLIFKESVNNAAKYSHCTKVIARLEKRHGFFQMEIKDDGDGFNRSGNGQGNGLQNMKQRAEEVNGRLYIFSEKGQGTIINLIMPITQNAD
jgi:ligand-binding sensor domain-containing protein